MTVTNANDFARKQALESLLNPALAKGEIKAWKLDLAEPPIFLTSASAALAAPGALALWLRERRSAVDAILLRHGAIVFRGFSVTDTSDFNEVVGVFEPYFGNYLGGGAPRAKIAGRVYEASRVVAASKIGLHQEMTYVARPPKKIIFFCRKPAEHGGETIIADMRRVTRELPQPLREKLEALGVLGVRNFAPPPEDEQEPMELHPDQRPWCAAFQTNDPREVEAACREKGFNPEWLANGGLTVRTILPAFMDHEVTGEHIYRSVLHSSGGRELLSDRLPLESRRQVEKLLAAQQFKTGFYLGDGTTLTEEESDLLRSLFNSAERSWTWEPSDIMLLDNLLTAHGRNPFEGTRDVQVALLD